MTEQERLALELELLELELLELEADENPDQAATSQSAPTPAPKTAAELFKEAADNHAKWEEAFRSGVFKGASLGYANPPVPEGYEGTAKAGQIAGGVGAGLLTGGLASAGLKALAPAIANSAIGRFFANLAIAGSEGAARKPEEGEDRFGNAVDAMTVAGPVAVAAELVGPAVRATKGGMGWLGSRFSGLTADEAAAYARQPLQAEALATTLRDNPEQITRDLKTMLGGQRVLGGKEGGAIAKILDEVVAPARAAKMAAGTGKTVRVNVADFAGTAAESELDRILNLRGTPAPRTEVTRVPINSTQAFSPDAVQPGLPLSSIEPPIAYSFPPARTPIDATEAVPQGGATQVQMGLPLSTKETSTVSRSYGRPRQVTLTFAQADRLRQMAADEAYSKAQAAAQGQLRYNSASDADARLANNLRAAMDFSVGEGSKTLKKAGFKDLPDVDSKIQEALTMKRGTEREKFNLARLLYGTETIGTVPARSIRNFLDRNAGTNLNQTADLLQAGTRLIPPKRVEGIADILRRNAAKRLILGSRPAEDLLDPISSTSAILQYLENR